MPPTYQIIVAPSIQARPQKSNCWPCFETRPASARYGSERQRFGDWIVGRGRDLGASIGMRAGAGARLDREELDRRAAAAVSAYAANADELSRLAVDGSIPGSV